MAACPPPPGAAHPSPAECPPLSSVKPPFPPQPHIPITLFSIRLLTPLKMDKNTNPLSVSEPNMRSSVPAIVLRCVRLSRPAVMQGAMCRHGVSEAHATPFRHFSAEHEAPQGSVQPALARSHPLKGWQQCEPSAS